MPEDFFTDLAAGFNENVQPPPGDISKQRPFRFGTEIGAGIEQSLEFRAGAPEGGGAVESRLRMMGDLCFIRRVAQDSQGLQSAGTQFGVWQRVQPGDLFLPIGEFGQCSDCFAGNDGSGNTIQFLAMPQGSGNGKRFNCPFGFILMPQPETGTGAMGGGIQAQVGRITIHPTLSPISWNQGESINHFLPKLMSQIG